MSGRVFDPSPMAAKRPLESANLTYLLKYVHAWKSESDANNILRATIVVCDPARAGKAQNKNAFPSLVIQVC
ncbi:hypothetical protein NC651_002097 [Populus alba x Populus x berolinensis]|nr:hypothetical protein NC651_002097 [Populus alba x Populus x berolinensis]